MHAQIVAYDCRKLQKAKVVPSFTWALISKRYRNRSEAFYISGSVQIDYQWLELLR